MRQRPRSLLVPAVIAAVAAGTLFTGVLTPRDLSQGEDLARVGTGDLAVFDLSRAVTGLLLLVCAAASATSLVRHGLPRRGRGLWLAYLGFVASNALVPGLLGAAPGLELRALYVPLVFTAVYFGRPVAPADLVALCKLVLRAFVYGSLVAGLIIPAQVVASGYEGLVPGLDFRLYGIGGGAVSLGAQSATLLAVEFVSPVRSRMRWLHMAAAGTALLLTQAKTSWALLLAGVVLLGLRRIRRHLPSVRLDLGPRGWRVVGLLLAGGLGVGLIALAGAVRGLDLTPVGEGDSLRTLTGRTYIWATSLAVWLESPVFGYGPSLWVSEAFRAAHGPFAHAHNQFLQSLAGAGVVGLLGLLLYLGTAWLIARRALPTSPVPFVLLGLFLVLSLTDVPLQGFHVLDAFTGLHLLLFAALMAEEGVGRSPTPAVRIDAGRLEESARAGARSSRSQVLPPLSHDRPASARPLA